MADAAFTIAAYLRVTSLAVAAYDYLETYPTAFRFYREHWQSKRVTISLILFYLLRLVSIVTLTISSVGFFYGEFTIESCSKFYLFPPAFKVVQAMVSQAILGIRAFNLSRRSKLIGWILLLVYSMACTVQWVATMYKRTPKLGDGHSNCRGVSHVQELGAYVFYAVAIIYDVLTTSLSIWYLLKYKFKSSNSVMSKLSKMMLYDGLGYLVVLTATNILNLILYKTTQEIQTAGASLGYCVSWIMSQRLLVHLYDASRERREDESFEAAITISKNVEGAHNISRAVRSQFEHKSTDPFVLSRHARDSGEAGDFQDDLGVQVRIERTVKLKHYKRTIELEDYSRRSRM